MRSVTSCFNKAVFLKTVKRFWPIWVIYNIIWIFSLPLALPGMMTRTPSYTTVARFVLRSAAYEGATLAFIFALISALAVFSYLSSAKSTGAFHTLPIRRDALFVSFFAAGLSWLLLSNVFIFLLSLLVQVVFGGLEILLMLQWLGIVSLECVFFFGFASFCAMLTGQGFALTAIYGVLNFAAVIIESIMRYCLSLFSYGSYVSTPTTVAVLSPLYKLLSDSSVVRTEITPDIYAFGYDTWTLLIIYGVVGLLFAFIALLIYRRRKSESASEFIAISSLRPVFKYFFAFVGSLVLGSMFYYLIYESSNVLTTGSMVPMLVCMIVGGFLGYYITAMLLSKSFRVFKTTSVGFAAYTLALIALISAFEFDLFGIETACPATNEVTALRVSGNGYSMTYDEDAVIERISAARMQLVENKVAHEQFLRQGGADINPYSEKYLNSITVSFTYQLTNGKTLSRRYKLYSVSAADLLNVDTLEKVVNSKDALADSMSDALCVTPESLVAIEVNYGDKVGDFHSEIFTKDDSKELLVSCIKEDIRAGCFGKASFFDLNKRKYDFTVNVRYTQDDPMAAGMQNEGNLMLLPGSDAERTLSYLKARGIEPWFEDPIYPASTPKAELTK